MKFARLITFLMLATFGMAATVPIKNPLIQGTDGQIVSGAVLGNAGTLNGAGTFNFASGTVTLPSGQIITTPSIVGAITFPDGTRQTFNPNGTNAGINVGAQAGNPSSLTNGDLWYNSSTGTLNAQIAGSTIILGDGTVHGPVSATDGHIVQFDGVTGKLLKDGLATSTGGNDSADSGKVPLFNASGGMSITGGLGVAEPGLTGIEGSYGHDGMYINNNGTTIWQHIYANPTGARENFIPDHSGNFVLVGDTGTVTNAMLAGSIDLATKVTGNLAVSHFNSGTGATATTFWRGDGTWTVPAGGGDTIGPASATDGHIVQFDGTTGKLLKDGLATTSGGNGAADVGKVPVLNAYGGYFFGSPTVVNGADNVVKVQGTGGFSLAATTDTGTAIDGSPLGTGGGFQCHLGTTGTYGMIVDGTAALPTSFAFGAYTSGQVLSVADATTAEHLAIFGDGRFILRDSTAGKAITFSAPTGMAADLACNWPTVAGTLLTNNSGIVATQMPAFTGDVTTSAGAVATTLATVNSNVGSFTNANITVNAKGLITAASSGSSGVTIDSTAITTGTAGRVLFESATNKVSEDAALTFTTGTGTLTATKFSGALNGTVGATTPASGAFTTLSASGVVTVSAGSVSAPAITTTGDTNTGIFFSAADNMNFVTGGVTRWYIDSGGTLQGSTNSIQLTGNTIGTYFYARGGRYAIGASDDVIMARDIAAVMQLGDDAASPVNQGFKGNDGVGTDKAGANLNIAGGRSTGTGRGGDLVAKTSITSTTASTANAYTTRRYDSAKFVDLTESTATLFCNIGVAASKYAGARLVCTVTANDGTDFQSLTSNLTVDAVNKAGTVTTTLAQVDGTTAASAGTLTVTYTAVANAATVDIKANAVSSLTQTVLRCKWSVISLNTDGTDTSINSGSIITPQ